MINFKNIILVYIFFICISYNLKWFYIVGSFSYADLLLPVLFLSSLKKTQFKLDYVTFLLIGLAFISCTSSLNAILLGSYDDFKVGYFFRSLYFVLLYLFLLNTNVSTDDVIKMILLSLLFSLLVCFYIWSTNPRYFGFSSMPMLHIRESPSGLVVNRNETGLTASLLYTISFYGLVYRKFFSTPVNIFLVILSLLTVALCFSKGAWLLTVIASVFIIAYRFKAIKLFFVSIFILILVPFLPISDFIFFDAVATRFTGSGETNDIRLSYVWDSVLIASDNLIFGIGPGNYKEYTIANGYTITIDPHNTFMQSFAELGIFGLLIVTFFYGTVLLQSFFNGKKEKNHIIVFVLVVLLTADSLQSGLSLTMKIFYILAALTMRKGSNVQS